jgi:hypothetical protein
MSELSEISEKLEILIKLSVAKYIDGKEFSDQVRVLNQIGFSPKRISEITGKTANNVSVTINNLKKKSKNKT